LFYILLKTRLLKEVYILASIFLLGVTSMVIGYGQILKSKTFLMYQNTQNSLTGSEANENLFGSIVLLCLPAAIYWFKKNIPGKILAIIYWILGGILIVKTGSRTATLAFLCVSVFSVIMLLNVGILKQLKYKFLTMFLIVIGAGIGLLIWHQNNPVLFRHDLSLNTLSLRLKLWDNSLKMINDNPVLGVGAGNWKIHFPVYGLKNTRVTAEVGSMSFVRPHNDFLWIASEMGIPAFLLFISTIIWLVISGLKAISRNQNTALNLVVISTLMGLVITSMADFPMERQNHLVVFALAAAIGAY